MTQLVVSKTFFPLPRRRPTSFRRDRRVCPPLIPKYMASQQARSVCSPPVVNAVKFRAHRMFNATVPFGRTRRLFLVTAPRTLAIRGGPLRLPDSPQRDEPNGGSPAPRPVGGHRWDRPHKGLPEERALSGTGAWRSSAPHIARGS